MCKLSKRTSARVVAVQSIYCCEFSHQVNIENLLGETDCDEDISINSYDQILLNSLLESIQEHSNKFDKIISQHIDEDWDLKRIETVILIILRAATCELIFFADTSTNVIIDEYTTITSYFANNQEVNFVNAILEKISSELRQEISS